MNRPILWPKAVALTCLLPMFSESLAELARAETPSVAYIFPAGAQRGTAVDVRIGGHFLHDRAEFEMPAPGIQVTSPIGRTETIWFEGPLVLLPASQQKEDYPKDYASRVTVAADAALGVRRWRCATSQGITPSLKFVVGDLPEVTEAESEGTSATSVTLPVTINGRIFPREDSDDWTFEARAGQVISCEVLAARIGSGLDSRLEVRDPQGRVIAENSDTFSQDSFVRFTAPADGRYSVRIHDIRFEGLQHFVYRLTISAGPWLDAVFPLGGQQGSKTSLRLIGANLSADRFEFAVPQADNLGGFKTVRGFGIEGSSKETVNSATFEIDDLPEHVEAAGDVVGRVTLPCALNGIIDRPEQVDVWIVTGKKGDVCQFDLRASRLGSELDGVLTLLGPKGNMLGTADDLANGQTDAVLTVTLPEDGEYTLRIQDRVGSRGGPTFGYRVRITDPRTSALRLTTAADTITLARGGEARIKIQTERPNGFADEIALEIDGLPDGVTVTGNKIGKGQNQVDVVLKAEATAKLLTSRLRITGKWKSGDSERSALVEASASPDDLPVNELSLRVALPTPFKLKGFFETKYAPRGSVFTRRFKIERNGYSDRLWAELADRQARHLQGVTGSRIEIPADATEFEYPFSLAPGMEIGRTSRTCVALFGEIVEPDGSKHVVSHTSQNPDEQAIVLIEPNRLSLETSRSSILWTPGGEARIPVRVSRAAGLRGIVRIAVRQPRAMTGLQIEPLEIPEGSSTGDVLVRFAANSAQPAGTETRTPGRITLQATMPDERGFPLNDEISIDLVTSP